MTAREFFDALRQCSEEVLRYYSLPTSPGPKTRSWQYGRPKGITFHYTAGVTWKGSANWLNSPENKHSSCHFLILDRKVSEVAPIVEKYPELQELEVLTLQLADLSRGTWHATWTNGVNVGIENRNAGMLKKGTDGWFWWANNWRAKYPQNELGKTPVLLNSRWWEPYTKAQLEANITIGRKLHELFGLERKWLLPHSAVDKQKYDTGPAFPFHDVRHAIFQEGEVRWTIPCEDGQLDTRSYVSDMDHEFMHQLSVHEGQLEDGPSCAFVEAEFKSLVTPGPWEDELNSIRRALFKLGYVVGFGSELDEDTKFAVYAFQKSHGLDADGIPGDKTQAALAARLRELGLDQA